MEKGKIVAIITGAISIFLAVAYLILVILLDLRGEMIPAPTSELPLSEEVAQISLVVGICQNIDNLAT
ncbi:MAG: glucose-inhibited division protein A [Moorea sp. SIO2B7]|nr:glucose-inhibited division protein A [Moorena sp. SIO2B7]